MGEMGEHESWHGQRSLTSPLLSRLRYHHLSPSPPRIFSSVHVSCEVPLPCRARSREGALGKPNLQSVSLSEFLDRKLGNSNLGNAGTVKEKKSSFSMIGVGRRGIAAVKGKERDDGGPFLSDPSIFRRVEDAGKEEPQDAGSSKKRSNPYGGLPGAAERHFGSKYLVVLGDDPKPKEKRMKLGYFERKPKPLFNHYATGRGLWDCGKEGIDTEEVGCDEAWEGMGSTTLGGLEWH